MKEPQFPGLVAMARDILCIPAAESLVERVFSAARDVCGYRRGHLTPKTIRAIMLVYYSRQYNQRQGQHNIEIDDIMDTLDMKPEDI